jgi:hypothetical protein
MPVEVRVNVPRTRMRTVEWSGFGVVPELPDPSFYDALYITTGWCVVKDPHAVTVVAVHPFGKAASSLPEGFILREGDLVTAGCLAKKG